MAKSSGCQTCIITNAEWQHLVFQRFQRLACTLDWLNIGEIVGLEEIMDLVRRFPHSCSLKRADFEGILPRCFLPKHRKIDTSGNSLH